MCQECTRQLSRTHAAVNGERARTTRGMGKRAAPDRVHTIVMVEFCRSLHRRSTCFPGISRVYHALHRRRWRGYFDLGIDDGLNLPLPSNKRSRPLRHTFYTHRRLTVVYIHAAADKAREFAILYLHMYILRNRTIVNTIIRLCLLPINASA